MYYITREASYFRRGGFIVGVRVRVVKGVAWAVIMSFVVMQKTTGHLLLIRAVTCPAAWK
jgi:hypothetical protein